MGKMPAVVQFEMKKGAVELREMERPEIGENEVLLRVRGVGVCGSDVHQYHNTQSWTVGVPVVLGHEFCGEIAAVGKGVKGWKEGDRVASETAAETGCGSCGAASPRLLVPIGSSARTVRSGSSR